MKRTGSLLWVCTALFLLTPARPSHAVFHLMVIEEVMTSYGGDPSVQFVECELETVAQNFVTDTVLGAFDAAGSYLGDVLVLPSDLIGPTGSGVRWIMGTQAFATLSGVTPDYIIPAALATGGGMVCWGAPGAGVAVPPPGSWDHTNPDNYVDCLAYGTYSGPTAINSGNPTPLDADGHSLVRSSDTNDNETDFECGDPATPETAFDGGSSASLAATTACPIEPVMPVLPRGGAVLLMGLLTGLGALLLLRGRTRSAQRPQ